MASILQMVCCYLVIMFFHSSAIFSDPETPSIPDGKGILLYVVVYRFGMVQAQVLEKYSSPMVLGAGSW